MLFLPLAATADQQHSPRVQAERGAVGDGHTSTSEEGAQQDESGNNYMNSFLLKVRNPLYFYAVERLRWDTSIQGHLHSEDTKFGPEKMFTLPLHLLPIEVTPLFRGKVPRPSFNLHPGDTLALKM